VKCFANHTTHKCWERRFDAHLAKAEKNKPMASILLVDEDDPFRTMLREVLTHAGYQVQEASDGQKAIELYQGQPTDLVITDLVMPEKEGLEMIVELKRLKSTDRPRVIKAIQDQAAKLIHRFRPPNCEG